ncbi:MAG TPA: primosomal protein N' [Anaerolineaceae bacterium]|nr:primosomal protein N' [Anaerolineaceae bacterium]
MLHYARISVNIPQLTGLFDYHIPDPLLGALQPGSLVNVPFGKQALQGIVVSLLETPEVPETREITALIESNPCLTPWQIQLAEWMAKENLSTLSLCLDSMLPAGLSQHADNLVKLLPDAPTTGLTAMQLQLIETLKKRGDLRGRQIDLVFPRTDWRASLPALVKKGVVESLPVLSPPAVRPRFIRTAQFSAPPGWEESQPAVLGRAGSEAAARRRRVMDFLSREAIPVNVSWVYAETGANAADLAWLAEAGLLRIGESELWRDPLEGLKPVLTVPPTLTADQKFAWQSIQAQLESHGKKEPTLLVGVTGSGKTELYLRAAAEALKQGKGVIILVPEISLTPQTVKRFFARFPGQVGLIHSRLSPGERYDTWRRIRSGRLPIVVGPRSALFSPLPDPGLVIIDECHDGSYHQEDFQPHYHTVETAIALSHITGCSLLMGSATPGVELLHQFTQNQWTVLELPRRILAHAEVKPGDPQPAVPVFSDLPEVQVVDMRRELLAGNRSALSRVLHADIGRVLEKQEQVILFLNRRGSSSHVFCRECGYVLRCPRCNTQLTFHTSRSALVCHTCNYTRQMVQKCPACGSSNIRQFGMGTESLEKLVVEQFPAARVLRWDADTSRYKGAHDLILDHFTQHRADILIGTQMLAKGLDLPLVTLVGVVMADTSLNLPDFRAPERTFQLLTQVAGRAGRSGRGGRVILQTFQPEHYAIQAAAAYDMQGFREKEMEYRQAMNYPPYTKLLKVEIRSTDEKSAQSAAMAIADQLNSRIHTQGSNAYALIGPVPCFYEKRAGYYRWQVLVRSPEPRLFLQDSPLQLPARAGLQVEITTDPVNLL